MLDSARPTRLTRFIPAERGRASRRLRLAAALLHRDIHRVQARLALFSGWVWVAAASLVGFEALELLLGALIAAPELLPLVLLALALAWHFRAALRRLIHRLGRPRRR